MDARQLDGSCSCMQLNSLVGCIEVNLGSHVLFSWYMEYHQQSQAWDSCTLWSLLSIQLCIVNSGKGYRPT